LKVLVIGGLFSFEFLSKARKKDPDFLLWDEDINLDDVLGEYTEDEGLTEVRKDDQCVYVCPDWRHEYKSISGFRGHTSKKHQKNLKGKLHLKLSF